MGSYLISVNELLELQKKSNVVVFDATWSLCGKTDPTKFKQEFEGKFAELINAKKHADFEASRIKGARPLNPDICCPPGEFSRFGFYSVDVFQGLLRFLGVNQGDELVVYARGPMGGMTFAARVAFVLSVYGLHPRVLNGGFSAWTSAGQPTESGPWTKAGEGNVTLSSFNADKGLATFDELIEKDAEGESIFDNLQKINYLDCRPKEQFETGAGAVTGKDSTGFRCRGAKHLGLGAVCSDSGIEEGKLNTVFGFLKPGVPTVTACTTGVAASLGWLALRQAGIPARVFSGSMTEVATRASHLINEK